MWKLSLAYLVLLLSSFGANAATLQNVPSTPAPQKSSSLPVFDFQGENTETVVSPTYAGCKPQSNDTVACIGGYQTDRLSGIVIDNISKSYYHGKIFFIQGLLTPDHLPDLNAAFTAKYGPAQTTEVEKWESKSGAVFDNPTSIWDFKGGTLRLQAMSDRSDEARFMFISTENAPTPVRPKVDF